MLLLCQYSHIKSESESFTEIRATVAALEVFRRLFFLFIFIRYVIRNCCHCHGWNLLQMVSGLCTFVNDFNSAYFAKI